MHTAGKGKKSKPHKGAKPQKAAAPSHLGPMPKV